MIHQEGWLSSSAFLVGSIKRGLPSDAVDQRALHHLVERSDRLRSRHEGGESSIRGNATFCMRRVGHDPRDPPVGSRDADIFIDFPNSQIRDGTVSAIGVRFRRSSYEASERWLACSPGLQSKDLVW